MKTKLMALEALKLALPHINPKAIDGVRVEAEPIADCYVNTIVSATIAAIEADIAKPSEPVGAESRFTESSAWLRCSVEHHYLVSAKPDEWPGYETRLLYTTPQEPAAAEIPEGWKLVPIEPNDAMQTAGAQAVRFDTTVINKIWTGNAVYRAMLAAAPGGAA